jgi:hypothetical protein
MVADSMDSGGSFGWRGGFDRGKGPAEIREKRDE